MKHLSMLCIFAVCLGSTLISAPRRSAQEKDRPVQQNPQTVSTQEQQDRDIMLGIMAVAANFGHVALAINTGKEKTFPTQQLTNFLSSIYSFAEVVMRGKKQRSVWLRRCV